MTEPAFHPAIQYKDHSLLSHSLFLRCSNPDHVPDPITAYPVLHLSLPVFHLNEMKVSYSAHAPSFDLLHKTADIYCCQSLSISTAGTHIVTIVKCICRFFCHLFQGIKIILCNDHCLCFCRSCSNGHKPFVSKVGNTTGDHRKIGTGIALTGISSLSSVFLYNNTNQDILLISSYRSGCKFRKRNGSLMIQFHICIKSQQAGQDIRKPKAGKNTARFCYAVCPNGTVLFCLTLLLRFVPPAFILIIVGLLCPSLLLFVRWRQ